MSGVFKSINNQNSTQRFLKDIVPKPQTIINPIFKYITILRHQNRLEKLEGRQNNKAN